MKTRSLALGILLGIAVVVSLGIVYIDTVQNYWYVNGGFVKLIVSNQTQQAIMTVDTNTLRVGFNTNNTARSFVVQGQSRETNATGNGASAATTGHILLRSGHGGNSALTTSASGGTGGGLTLQSGDGGNANSAVTNATGGTSGVISITGGAGGAGSTSTGVATNQATGGAGGGVFFTGGAGGSPGAAATNTVGGAGGVLDFTSGSGGQPSAGWSRKTGNSGQIQFLTPSTPTSTRTNSGDAGPINFTAGNSGNVTTAPGNPGNAGNINFTAGNGGTGDTNAFGGSIYALPGDGGSTAADGDVVLARNVSGTSRGGVMVGPLVAGSVSITNVLGGAASLDFPSTAAGAFSELTIAVTGVTSNNVAVALSVPWESAQTGGAFVTFNSNDVIYVRFINNSLVAAIDPSPGTFTVVGFRIR